MQNRLSSRILQNAKIIDFKRNLAFNNEDFWNCNPQDNYYVTLICKNNLFSNQTLMCIKYISFCKFKMQKWLPSKLEETLAFDNKVFNYDNLTLLYPIL